ncbi:MAG: LysM peptidoglycan-binding domain-containing protein [Treponema sp.]|jgi:murein DD-endopeptidase MepM/ murein hydrolase activator NlpD|nr:LysM peptidoglycan-binding domain-containing protein [Treponema sp.]
MNDIRGISRLFLFAAVFSFAALPVKLAAEDMVHVVAKGETVYSISRSYRVSPEALMRYNDVIDASRLQIGSRLRIPASPGDSAAGTSGAGGAAASSAAPSAKAPVSGPAAPGAAGTVSVSQGVYTEYRVVKDDTLYSIARSHGVSLQALRNINGFNESYVLKAGERIKVPSAPVTAAGNANSGPAAPAAPTRTSQGGGEVRQTASTRVDASLRWPVKPKELAYMTGKLYGVVLEGERTEPVKSLTQGTVISAGPYRGFGGVAIVQVTGGYLYVYGGCESLSVKEGDRIGPGTELGKLGIDAVSSKPQLFFLVYRNNAPIDPAKAPRA